MARHGGAVHEQLAKHQLNHQRHARVVHGAEHIELEELGGKIGVEHQVCVGLALGRGVGEVDGSISLAPTHRPRGGGGAHERARRVPRAEVEERHSCLEPQHVATRPGAPCGRPRHAQPRRTSQAQRCGARRGQPRGHRRARQRCSTQPRIAACRPCGVSRMPLRRAHYPLLFQLLLLLRQHRSACGVSRIPLRRAHYPLLFQLLLRLLLRQHRSAAARIAAASLTRLLWRSLRRRRILRSSLPGSWWHISRNMWRWHSRVRARRGVCRLHRRRCVCTRW